MKPHVKLFETPAQSAGYPNPKTKLYDGKLTGNKNAGKKYVLASALMMILIVMSFTMPVTFVLNGTVVDASTGVAIKGVTVSVKGSGTKVLTDAHGAFNLTIEGRSQTLEFSYVGYITLTKKVKDGDKNLIIKLTSDPSKLEEVVVTGYGTVKKTDLLGSVAGVQVSPSMTRSVQLDQKVMSNQYYKREHEAPLPMDREGYDAITENGFKTVGQDPLSTFSIDVDAASYSNVRRMLNMGQLPPAGAVRIEEMINYFKYDYKAPVKDDPFSINTEIAACPWNNEHQLVSIGLQGKLIPTDNLPASNLVFLIDVSGSMENQNKLPLVQQSLKLLVDQLREKDRVALVVYAGNAGLVLPSTSGDEKIKIKDAIDRLSAGGSTAGGEGIKLAYKTARENFIKPGNNRIILCSDGDFNVGASSDAALEEMIETERKSGVFLTILGYGMGNYQDAKMQKLAGKGNGNHAYIDNLSEARKVLVKEFGGTLFAIAKDVKLQIEFNPAKVQAYRLVGYENRMLNKEDFNDDLKDAGELGSGHTVTALYEIIPVGVKSSFIKSVDELKYQKENTGSTTNSGEMMTIKFRYKKPDSDVSSLISHPVMFTSSSISKTSENFRFAAAVAQFGMLLRKSEYKQQSSYQNTWTLAKDALGKDEEGYRSEFLKMIRNAQTLQQQDDVSKR
ncbi:vWA domain-containing protein [Flavitalea sp.]|nr:von Willebrand factor type A domain-containing protein [Flavitalea sp.]